MGNYFIKIKDNVYIVVRKMDQKEVGIFYEEIFAQHFLLLLEERFVPSPNIIGENVVLNNEKAIKKSDISNIISSSVLKSNDFDNYHQQPIRVEHPMVMQPPMQSVPAFVPPPFEYGDYPYDDYDMPEMVTLDPEYEEDYRDEYEDEYDEDFLEEEYVEEYHNPISSYETMLEDNKVKTSKESSNNSKDNLGDVLDLGPIDDEDDIFSTPRLDDSKTRKL